MNMHGELLPYNTLSVLDLQVIYNVSSLRHLIVPAAMVDKYRELEESIVIGNDWVRLTYHGVMNIADALDVAFPEKLRCGPQCM
jgi:hypothetical protein